jgi:molybdenum cofactor biosynthesis enzyme MoaA
MNARRALELALDYRCNLRCVGCRACQGGDARIAPERAAALLREHHERGARSVWFGGGEPTLRDDLLALVKRARELGYESVTVQTNGQRLAYPAYAAAVAGAGVTEIRVNAKSHRAAVHDALSRVEGAHALLVRALGNLAALGVRVAADVLLTRTTAPELPATVAFLADHGVRAVALWLLSAFDADEAASEVPRIADLLEPLASAAEVARSRGVALASFHTPPCTLPVELRTLWLPAADLALTVVDPGGHAFSLESSPFEGGAPLEACDACAMRGRCRGPRKDYLDLHGASEFRALSSSLPESPR